MTTESDSQKATSSARKWTISLDWWAVLTALAIALLVLLGIITSVPW